MAPVSTRAKPRRRASTLDTVDLPAPAGPSMATMKGLEVIEGLSPGDGTVRLTSGEHAELAEALVAIPHEIVRRQARQLIEVLAQRLPHVLRRLGVVAVRAARGLGDDLVDDVHPHEVARRELERVRRLLRLGGVTVEDG